MAIRRIESLAYGADDVAAGIKYFTEWGLETVETGASGATFRTPANQLIHLRKSSDESLPAAPEGRNTMLEATWGVDGKDDLEALGAELSKDRQIRRDPDGTIHARDDSGNAIAFAVQQPAPLGTEFTPINQGPIHRRVNQVIDRDIDRQAKPMRIGHIVYSIKSEGWEAAADFYLKRLGFKLSDRSLDLGDFMRPPGRYDHHALFLLHRANQARFDHVAFEVPNFDELMTGGNHMKKRGWKSVTRPGRHMLGSNLFWYFQNPSGGKTEYFADVDIMDDDWVPQIHEKHPGWAIWEMSEK